MCASAGDSGVTAGETEGPPVKGRRSFLAALAGIGSVLIGALLGVPLIRFALFPLIRRTTDVKNSALGTVSEFASMTEPVMRTIQVEQVDGWRKAISEKAVYITRDQQGRVLVLSAICPHLGCNVPWNKDRKEFVCPCHGGTFASNGDRVSGPSQRGMDALETSVEGDQLTVHFQYFRQLVSDKQVIG